MVKFLIGNTYTTVVSNFPTALEIINRVCTFTHIYFPYKWICLFCNNPTSFRGRSLYCSFCGRVLSKNEVKKKPKAETYDLKYFKDRKFPSGLLPRVIKELKSKGINCEWKDYRGFLVRRNPLPRSMPSARYYQKEAKEKALKKSRGIINIPTRGGKTYIAADFVFDIGAKSLIIVPNLYLLHQTYEVFKEYIDNKSLIGLIGDSIFEPSLINIATIQTINSRFTTPEIQRILNDTEVLIIDEAHHISFSKK